MFKAIIEFFKKLFGIKNEEPERPSVTPPVEVIPPSEPAKPVEQPKPQKLLWYPAAVKHTAMPKRGTFKNNYPIGLIVHFNAGRNNAKATIDYGITQGYNYLAMDREGVIYQPNPLNEWGYHAGTSSWNFAGKTLTSVSQYLVGIEMCAAGQVTKDGTGFKSWFGEKYTAAEVRQIAKKADNAQVGYYHKYTEKQEAALIAFCLWLKRNNPDVFNFDYVLGHDEVAPTRKNDPGGALSMTMPQFRALLKKLYSEGK